MPLAGNPWDIMLSYPQHTEVIWIIGDRKSKVKLGYIIVRIKA